MTNKRDEARNVDGILLLDKPSGISSNHALQIIKRLYNANKAGHTGSLDPLASGMLPICLGQATKFTQFLLEAKKTYNVTCKLGVKTTTGDSEGEIVKQDIVPRYDIQQLKQILAKYIGEIQQVPSMYSAIKHNGQPLYKLARVGITIERKARPVNIYYLKLIKYVNDILELELCCSKGTYVRTLVEDIGDDLQCGAHVIVLRRLSVNHYQYQQMIDLQKLQIINKQYGQNGLDALLLPIESIVADWNEVQVSEAAAHYLRQGQKIIAPYAPDSGMVVLRMKSGAFFGIGEILSDGKVAPRRLLN